MNYPLHSQTKDLRIPSELLNLWAHQSRMKLVKTVNIHDRTFEVLTGAMYGICSDSKTPPYHCLFDACTHRKVIAIHIKHTSKESQTPIFHSFQPICLLHNATQLAGRATWAWLVKEDSQFYVLKDSWVLFSHPCSEIETLKKINNTMKSSQEHKYLKHCYPILVAAQDLGDSTDIHRPEASSNSPPPWTHCRIVTGPVGNLLTSFQSKREFCSCICDVVKCKPAQCHLISLTACIQIFFSSISSAILYMAIFLWTIFGSIEYGLRALPLKILLVMAWPLTMNIPLKSIKLPIWHR